MGKKRSITTGLIALSAIFLAACGVSKTKYSALQTELEQTKAEKATAEAEIDGLLTKLATTEQAVESEKATLEELKEKTATYENLVSSLKEEINDGKVTISKMKDRLTVNLVDKILFDSGRTEVKDEGKSALQKVADVLKSVDDKRIQVVGHTDNIPITGTLKAKFPTNWELSTARATSVVRYLAELEVPTKRLSAAGFSHFKPVAPNDTEEGRQQNRRIEIVLLPDAAEKASSETAE